MSHLFLVLMISPLWPIGPNPLPGDPFVIVNKRTNELTFIDNREVQQVVHVATGKTDSLTPEGMFTIIVKAENPYYRKKDIPGGKKNNPLGTRWIGFDAKETDGRIYGIHGTNDPETIGHYVSNGCIRLKNDHVEALFERIPIGTKILIVSTDETTEQLAKKYGAL
ncbi:MULTISPECIES: L,D-transpeptidase [Cytobacillus]|uniref:L,D-transpeptidase n=1 Tax=Cytobacillus TaxID=2675230 RepID=UPI001CD2B07A|nr:L,D-transpeptidase [Cytobacillus kochii]MCA1025565.1 L,D-transpeptidase [Cytobacillus kochii]MCM3320667.1 L,D-transpeptidase [Cytobacillus kochii]MCM3344499.1 L,D-transpeptidase [Cytobacillus kochii]MDM5208343.1 L,D-transpeptidase [Cytobacillus kochii]